MASGRNHERRMIRSKARSCAFVLFSCLSWHATANTTSPTVVPDALFAGAMIAALGLLTAVLAYRRLRLNGLLLRTAAQLQSIAGEPQTQAELPSAAMQLSAAFQRVRGSIDNFASQAAAQAGLRAQTRESVRDLTDRYGLAIRGADDGVWEWDLRRDRAHFSARWKSLLGYADDELSDRMDEWSERIHVDDYDSWLSELEAHMEGRCAYLQSEHRCAIATAAGAGCWRVQRSCGMAPVVRAD